MIREAHNRELVLLDRGEQLFFRIVRPSQDLRLDIIAIAIVVVAARQRHHEHPDAACTISAPKERLRGVCRGTCWEVKYVVGATASMRVQHHGEHVAYPANDRVVRFGISVELV